MSVHHLVVGPATHGVTRLALQLAAGESTTRVDRPLVPADVGWLLAALPSSGTHAHVTDRLFGAGPAEAADVVTALAATPLSVTLHDLPQESDGADSMRRRAACYAAVARVARRVVVSSEHERLLLEECFALTGARADDPDVAVVPLPVDRAGDHPVGAAATPPDVGVLGFVYPGKGHAEVLAALTDLDPDVGLLVLGAPSPGHQDVVDALVGSARALGRRLVVTGYLPDAELAHRLTSVAVPVAAHRHVSASGSINSWLCAGRRPLVSRSRYTVELAGRLPGALTLYDDLPVALRRALAEPSSTWLVPGTPLGPGVAEVAGRYREVLA